MSWRQTSQREIDGVTMTVFEHGTQRNRHGSLRYRVDASMNGVVGYTAFVDQHVWLGHCYGSLLLPEIARRALLPTTIYRGHPAFGE